jgi:hypothetical protein
MIETLATIDAPHFHAGIVLLDGVVVEAAPIVGYMKKGKWKRDQVRALLRREGLEDQRRASDRETPTKIISGPAKPTAAGTSAM